MKQQGKGFSNRQKPSLRRRRHSEPLTAILSLRISEDELLLLKRLSRKRRLSASDIMRDAFQAVLRKLVEGDGLEPAPATT